MLEGHPETSFAEIAGAPLSTKKTEPPGQIERLALLESLFGDEVTGCVNALPKKWSVDAVDALALTWTATRVISKTCVSLGGDRDLLRRPMQLTI